ncbi:Zn-dependent hydrolase [Planococcus sp. CPCC 101016]|uniref:Zn-dependent hydrolase n=1 Tax=Planococcus sp. CPCC 101016 TaxID=2599617 RepID=UPI0011B3AEA8|nr:Zn-dependent hydrolase [Planococcus sp. CPCC 101016]TWT06567.1 Zn-dependent hydrolase [Planococcus sp. CPCC 101016]
MNKNRIEKTLNEINKFGGSGVGINRLAYTEEEQQAKSYFVELCKKEGMKVKCDSAGNIIARREGANPSLPVIAFGSHLDTVYEGGKYDGAVGVVIALEIIRSLNEEELTTEHPLEIISFAGEESARFGYSTIGSKAMAGIVSKECEELKDNNNIFLKDELSKYSFNLAGAKRKKEEFKAFFEIHIEQGPILENENKSIAVVTGIAGPTRYKLKIEGQASHSGTTPMRYRKDAFLGAAEIALELETAAKKEEEHGTVATTGVCEVKPGAMNVVPGSVEMKIDIRGISSESKNRVINQLHAAIENVENSRNLKTTIEKIADENPILLNDEVIESLKDTAENLGYPPLLLPSGAGHDAMNMAKLCPTGLLFIPSKAGLSHHPQEYTSLEEIIIGAKILKEEVVKWAKIVEKAGREQS